MDLASLEVFRAVAETGGVTRAAERLRCVQSNVTARVLGLERELGTRLFDRRPRGMALTSAGRVLRDYAERLLALADEAARAVREAEGRGGPFTLGAMESTAAVRLPRALAALARQLPGASVTLRTGPTQELVRDVLAARVDAALVASPVEHPDLTAEPLYCETLVAVTARGRRRLLPLRDPVLLAFRTGCSYRARAEEWLRRTGSPDFRVVELGTLEGILGCVAAGMGLAVLPRAVVERPPHRGRFRIHRLPEAIAAAPTCLVRRKGAHPTRAVTALGDILRRSGAAVQEGAGA